MSRENYNPQVLDVLKIFTSVRLRIIEENSQVSRQAGQSSRSLKDISGDLVLRSLIISNRQERYVENLVERLESFVNVRLDIL